MNLEQIDTSTTAGKAEVMRLAAEGRMVMDNAGGEWTPIKHPCWNWEEYSYAIISEPVGPDEVWVVLGPRDEPIGAFIHEFQATACSSGEAAWKSIRYLRADLAGEGK